MAQTREGIIERLVGIAASREIPIEHVGEGRHVAPGESAGVWFDVAEWGNGHLVHLWAPAVVEIPAANRPAATEFANRMNRDSYFIKWTVHEPDDEEAIQLHAEYDLLADAMDAEEFLNALSLVMSEADSLDEGLASDLDGKTLAQAAEEADVAD